MMWGYKEAKKQKTNNTADEYDRQPDMQQNKNQRDTIPQNKKVGKIYII